MLFRKKWFWFVIVLVVIGGYWYISRKNVAPTFTTAQVTRGDISQVVSVSATLLADQDIDLNFEIAGRLREVTTRVGSMVSQGDVLATMESVALSEELAKAQSALDKARADAGLNNDELREARKAASDAKEYLLAVEDAEDQKVDAADQAYDNAADYEDDAQSYYNQEVSDNGASSAEAKSARLTLTTATNSKKASEEAKDTARRNRDVAVQTAKNTYNAAKEKVKTLESESQEVIENSAIAIAQSDYDIALNALDKARIKAPVNGTITRLNYEKGEVIGSSITQPFGQLLSSDLILEAKVPESDIATIRLEQAATVTFDAFGTDEAFDAKVIEIDPNSTVIQDVVYYIVKLRLATLDQRLKPGMSGDIDIHIAEKKNVLLLPTRTVKQDGNTRYVEVVKADGKTTERRNVTVGLESGEGQTEITSGLEEGDKVISS